MKLKIKHTWNQSNKIGIRYEDGSVEFVNPPWYFAIKLEDGEKAKKLLYNFPVEIKTNGRFPGFAKIYTPIPLEERSNLVMMLEKSGIETYEGDLLSDRRYYIDSEIEIAEKYKKLYFDIETDDTINFIEIGRDRIISFAAIDSDGKVFFEELQKFNDKEEEILLVKILKIIKNYDLILGWNSKGFDVPYLKMRMWKYDLHKTEDYCWKELGHFDLLQRFRHIFRFDNQIKSFSLENISNHFLQEGKVKRTEKTIELWKNNKQKLKEYNIQDSLLVKKLDEELGVSEMMIRQSNWCGVPVGQFGLYSIIDAYIMRCAHKVGKYVKTSMKAIEERNKKNERGNLNPDDLGHYDTYEESHKKIKVVDLFGQLVEAVANVVKKRKKVENLANYSGAIVLEPHIGKYKNVYTFDFKGLYPSLMRTSNIGYDTIRFLPSDNCIINPGTAIIPRMAGELKPTYFDKDPSVINIAITELITKRSEYKKLKLKMIEERKDKGPKWERIVSDEIIVKELANSTYGIMGLQYGRYFSVDVAESITLFGQWCINYAKEFFEKEYGYEVIYGDTDSVFVATGTDFDPHQALDKFHKSIANDLKIYNITETFIQLEFDKKYEGLILTAKKNYAGRVTNIEGKETDQVYIRGLDCIKKSTFEFASKKQRELIDKLLYEDLDFVGIQNWCNAVKDEFFNREFTAKELTIINKIGRPLKTYKSKSLHIRLAQIIYERTGEFQVGKEVEYIITSTDNRQPQGVLTEDYNGKFDRHHYWTKKTVPILERILNVVHPNVDFFSRQMKLF